MFNQRAWERGLNADFYKTQKLFLARLHQTVTFLKNFLDIKYILSFRAYLLWNYFQGLRSVQTLQLENLKGNVFFLLLDLSYCKTGREVSSSKK